MYKKLKVIVAWSIAFIVFTMLTVKGIFRGIDSLVFQITSGYSNPLSEKIFSTIRLLGNYNFCVPIALITSLYAFFVKSKKLALLSLIMFILLINAEDGLKNITKQERPRVAAGYVKKSFSYPSGHSSLAFYQLYLLAMLVGRAKKLRRDLKELCRGFFYGLIIAVGISSICLGVHWLSDVIGGYILGYIFFLILNLLSEDVLGRKKLEFIN